MKQTSIPLQLVEIPTPKQVDVHKGGCESVGSPCWSRFLSGFMNPWKKELMLEQIYCQDLQFCEGPTLQEFFLKNCMAKERPHAGAGGEFSV